MARNRHPKFELILDVLIIVAVLLGAISTYRANDAENRTRDIAKAAAVQAHLNCVTLKQGRTALNDHNKNILLFIHRTVPPDQQKDPNTIAYFKLANKLFGQQLPAPKCI